MNLIHALIFGVVEGASEFLPISSTGHLILTARLLGLTQSDFLKSFEIAIQLGAILSVVVLYGRRFLLDIEVLKRIGAAFFPTALVGFFLYKIIKKFLIGNEAVVLWALFLGGIFLIVFEKRHGRAGGEDEINKIDKMSYRDAVWVGLCQTLAVIPGVSRSAATIVGGLALGIERQTIVEFSFLLAVPTMLAATALDLAKSAVAFSTDQWEFLLCGFIASFFAALVCVRWLVAFVKDHSFVSFGIYRILVALFFWFVFKGGRF